MKILLVFSLLILVSLSVFARSDAGYFEYCRNPEAGYTSIPFYANGLFYPECAPDVLYSWAIYDESFLKFPKDPLRGKGYAYTWRTPLGSFGYGNIQLRYKLKKGVTFKLIDESKRNCRLYTSSEKSNTIFVAWLHRPEHIINAVDYIICSPEVIESWSEGTYGAYYETAKERDFIENQNIYNRDRLASYDGYSAFDEDGKRFPEHRYGHNDYFATVADPRTNWNDYNRRVRGLLHKQAQIYYADGVPKDPHNHFKTKVDSYFALSSDEIKRSVLQDK